MAPGPAGFPELLGGVDGDPAPEPQVVHGPVSELAHEPVADLPEAPSGAGDPAWQWAVDQHRADFGLAPLTHAADPVAVEGASHVGGLELHGADTDRVVRLIRRRAERSETT